MDKETFIKALNVLFNAPNILTINKITINENEIQVEVETNYSNFPEAYTFNKQEFLEGL